MPQVLSQFMIMAELCVESAGATRFFIEIVSGSSLSHDNNNDDIHTQKTATNATKNDIDCRLLQFFEKQIFRGNSLELPPQYVYY